MESEFFDYIFSWNPLGELKRLLAFVVDFLAKIICLKIGPQSPDLPSVPPRPFGVDLPIIGDLFRLDHSNVHRSFTDLSRRHGDIFRLKLGSWPVVVINGQAAVNEANVRHGVALASRPNYRSYSCYAGGKSISFQPYCKALRLHRQVTLRTIKQLVQSGFAEEIISRQMAGLTEVWLDKGRCSGSQSFDPAADLTMAVAGGLYSMCYGRDASLAENKDYASLLLHSNPSTELFAVGNPVDMIPWFMCPLAVRKKYLEYVDRMSTFQQLNTEQVCKHLEQRTRNLDDNDDVVDAMITAADDLQASSELTKDHFLNTPIEMLSAGSDTSSTTLLWLLYFMAKYPEVQEKIHEEMDCNLQAHHQSVSYSDRPILPYTVATILEAMRLRTVVPFGLPHFSTQEVHLKDYTIPKHCLVFMNLWSVCHDHHLWNDPEDFRPERFLAATESSLYVDETKANMFYPFGLGKRRCVGEMLGRLQVFLFFANIMHRFDIKIGQGESLTATEIFGDILKPGSFRIIAEARKL